MVSIHTLIKYTICIYLHVYTLSKYPAMEYVRAFHLETIHCGEINTPRYMELLGYCRDQYLTLGY